MPLFENAILGYEPDPNTVQALGVIISRWMAEKDKTGMSVSESIEKAVNQRYGGQKMTRFKEYSAGYDPKRLQVNPGDRRPLNRQTTRG